MGYYFYYPLKNKIFVSQNAEFFENSFMVQEVSGSHGLLEMSGTDKGLEIVQEEVTQPSENISEEHNEVTPIEVEPQNVRVPIRRSAKIPQVPNRYGYYVDVEEYELADHNEPPIYKAALADPESYKWLEAMNTKMQSMKDNQVWYLVYLPSNAEYIVAAEASMEAVWIRKIINGLRGVMPSNKRPMEMLCDNEPALAIASDPKISKGARHLQRKYHYIREVIQEGEIVLKKVHTDDNVVDLFTKPMPFNKYFEHAMAIGIVPASSLM
nr:hypothetical protein [Tanacetum cinerariifolium]